MSTTPEDGRVYDVRYAPYSGSYSGAARIGRRLFDNALRTVTGVRGTTRHLVVPALVAMTMIVPALVYASIAAYLSTPTPLVSYDGYLLTLTPVLLLFCSLQAPELVSVDRDAGVTVLYAAKGVSPALYLASRVIALAVALFLLSATPLFVLLLGQVLGSSTPWLASLNHIQGVALIPAMAITLSITLSVISVAIATAFRHRVAAGVAILGFFLLLMAVRRLAVLYPAGSYPGSYLLDPTFLAVTVSADLFRAGGGTFNTALPAWTPPAALVAWVTAGLIVVWLRSTRTTWFVSHD